MVDVTARYRRVSSCRVAQRAAKGKNLTLAEVIYCEGHGDKAGRMVKIWVFRWVLCCVYNNGGPCWWLFLVDKLPRQRLLAATFGRLENHDDLHVHRAGKPTPLAEQDVMGR